MKCFKRDGNAIQEMTYRSVEAIPKGAKELNGVYFLGDFSKQQMQTIAGDLPHEVIEVNRANYVMRGGELYKTSKQKSEDLWREQ
jgi:hypothetical protein